MIFFVMRVSRPVASVITAVTAALLLGLIWRAGAWPTPPVLNVASIEPIEMIDENGAQLWLVTFNIRNRNQDSPPGGKRNILYVKRSQRAIEARVRNHWRNVKGTTEATRGIERLAPEQQSES